MVVDHKGRSEKAGASCRKVNNVDENKVNEQLEFGRALGRWRPENQCQSFAAQVIKNALIGSYREKLEGRENEVERWRWEHGTFY